MAIARQRLTLEQFLQLPEEEPALEYVDGVVTQKVSPKLPHGTLQFELGVRIKSSGHPVRVCTETRVTFAGRSVVPDLIVYRRERLPRTAGGELADDATVPPNLAVEIASPGQDRRALLNRCRWHAANGVSLAILADPRDRSAYLFRPGDESGPLRGGDVLDLGDALPGLALTADDLFAPLEADWL